MSDQQPGYEPPGYGAYGYGYGGYETGGGYGAYGYGGGYVPPDPKIKSQATMAFVFNIVACVLCCGIMSLPGLIVGGMAMSKAETEPESARNLTKWAWICLGITLGLAVLGIIVFVILGVTGALDDSSSDY